MEEYIKSSIERQFGKRQINLSGFAPSSPSLTNSKTPLDYREISTTKVPYSSISYIQKGEESEEIKISKLKDRISDEEDLEQVKYLIEDLQEEGAKVDEDGYVTVYHNLSKYNKKSFEKTGELGGGSNGIIFSTKKDGKIKGYGDKILTFKIPIEKFIWAGSFKNEVLLKIPFKSSYKKINVKKYLVNNNK